MKLLVTGTDTEVGKTHVGEALCRALTVQGVKIVAIKPVESGCDGSFVEDGERLATATGQVAPLQALECLKTPVAPPVAAALEDATLTPASWSQAILGAEADLVLFEGAGGALSPLDWGVTALDLAVEVGASALLVSANRLGVLNHTALTIEACQSRGIRVLGVVLNDASEDATDASRETNLWSLRRMYPEVPVAVMRYGEQVCPPEVVAWLG